MTVQELVKAVQDYAYAHYETGGWDYIVETFEDEELAEIIGKARTVEGAIRKVRPYASGLGERRADVRGEIW